MSDFHISHLTDTPAAIPALKELFLQEWAAWYGPGGNGDAQIDLTTAAKRNTLPVALVALDSHKRALGCAMLKAQSVGAKLGYGPFLAAFVVRPQARRRGVGSGLVAAIEAVAARLGFSALYGATDSAGGILLRRGWDAIDRAPSSRGDMVIYRLNLSSQSTNAE